MEYWTELRTALSVARLWTVSAATEALGVQRATVNRHVETLEGAFGAPLFQRHARGYALTDAGHDMLEVAGRADEMFADLAGRARDKAGQLPGALILTALGLHTTDPRVVHGAVCKGPGLGFLAEHDARVRPHLVAVILPGEAWSTALWVFTHVDLHRTAKVQAFLGHLKAHRQAAIVGRMNERGSQAQEQTEGRDERGRH